MKIADIELVQGNYGVIVSEDDREKDQEIAKTSVTRMMVENNPEWRQQIVLTDGVIADMPKPLAIERLFVNKCVTGWKFRGTDE